MNKKFETGTLTPSDVKTMGARKAAKIILKSNLPFNRLSKYEQQVLHPFITMACFVKKSHSHLGYFWLDFSVVKKGSERFSILYNAKRRYSRTNASIIANAMGVKFLSDI